MNLPNHRHESRLEVALAFSAAMLVAPTAALAAGAPMPASGSTTFAAYATCHQLSAMDMGESGSRSVAECVGIVKNTSGSKIFENMSVRCLEDDAAHAAAAEYTGWCTQTDLDGDKVFTTYESASGGKVSFIGGTGKYKGIEGAGTWTAQEAPQPSPTLGAVALSFSLSWTIK